MDLALRVTLELLLNPGTLTREVPTPPLLEVKTSHPLEGEQGRASWGRETRIFLQGG